MAGVAALATVGGFVIAAGGAGATATATTNNISGPDRYATAAALASATFSSSTNVIIASGNANHFPDALAGNYLAGQLNAPILLTDSNLAALPSATVDELAKLKPTTVYVLGDVNAVPAAQATQLTSLGYTVTRLGGVDRFATDKLVAEQSGASSVGLVNGLKTAIVANSQKFPDALSSGPLAFANHLPVVITPATSLNATASATLTDLGIQQVIIVGDTNSVSAATEAAINALGISTLTRLGGVDRSDTSRLIAEWELSNAGFTNATFTVATGDNSKSGADALAAGPFGGAHKTPTLVTNSTNDAGSVVAYATAHASTVNTINILGTTASIPAAVSAAILSAAQSTASGASTVLPQLISAAVSGTVTSTQANSSNPEGTTVKYTFSHNVLSANAADFLVYNAADSVTTGTPGSSATVSGNVVSVLFSGINTTSGGGAADASQLSLATVLPSAVTDGSGHSNPIGSAGVGTTSSSTTSASANTTTAPDLRSVGSFKGANPAGPLPAGPNTTAVNFTFDQAATTVTPAGFHLITTQGAPIACTGPAVGDPTAGNGTVAGGNGTSTITVICPDSDVTGAANTTTIPASIIARGYVDAGAVKGTDTTAASNVVMSATVSNGGITTAADLLSASFIPAKTGSNTTSSDDVIYVFDQSTGLAAGAATGFNVVKSNATVVTGGTIAQVSSDGKQVVVAYPAGTLTNAVGASVDTTNTFAAAPASVGVNPVATSTTSVTPGKVAAPQLTGVKVVKSTDVLGNVSYTAQYTFSYAVTLGAVADFSLYPNGGANWPATACAVDSTNNNQVNCTTFTLPAGTSDISGAVLGTAANGAVTGNTAASSNAAPNAFTNPEGAVNVG